jgi:ElaA protein
MSISFQQFRQGHTNTIVFHRLGRMPLISGLALVWMMRYQGKDKKGHEKMTDDNRIAWQVDHFDGLGAKQLYELLKLRLDVFVVEQACAYPELDGKDVFSDTLHITGRAQDSSLAAYARILAPGVRFSNVSFGRVVVAPAFRKTGLGHVLVKKILAVTARTWPNKDVTISAQNYLRSFYKSHGFVPVSNTYLEDGIAHIDMTRNQA